MQLRLSTEKRATLNASDDELRTIYFALREYRDNLHASLQKVLTKDLDQEDYCDDEGTIHEVPQVHLTAMLNNSSEYEEFMFLFETLSKINALLFDMTQNFTGAMKDEIAKFLNV